MQLSTNKLNTWLWKWHVIAGVITLPFVVLLSVTGVIYLFKDDANAYLYQSILHTTPPQSGAEVQPLATQYLAASQFTDKEITAVRLPTNERQTTAFRLAGKGHAGTEVYVNPYTAEVTGEINRKDTIMYDIRKLHGELLLNKPGTLVVEFVASWFIVLLLTGLYVWWPRTSFWREAFCIRTNRSARLFWRDIHAVLGFWLSLFMLIIIAGGMPWTDVFGGQLKWVQKQTDTGYPHGWRNTKGIHSPSYQTFSAVPDHLTLHDIETILQPLHLSGTVTVNFPDSEKGVYKISNRAFWLSDQKVLHVDQYTGEVIRTLQWDDVGILMQMRQFFMKLHQGEYGNANWYVLLIVSVLFILSTVAGVISYLKRKPSGSWGIPRVPTRFQVDKYLIIFIIFLGILFPLFGLSLIMIQAWGIRKRITR